MPELLGQEETARRYQCAEMKAAVDLANQYKDKIVEWLNKNTKYRYWEYRYTATCSSLYHDWGACLHFQYVKRIGGGYCNEFHLLEVYVHMYEDSVTLAWQTPGYQPTTVQHMPYDGFTYETLNDLDKLFKYVPWNKQQRKEY